MSIPCRGYQRPSAVDIPARVMRLRYLNAAFRWSRIVRRMATYGPPSPYALNCSGWIAGDPTDYNADTTSPSSARPVRGRTGSIQRPGRCWVPTRNRSMSFEDYPSGEDKARSWNLAHDCVVIEMSDGGVRLHIAGFDVPEEFTLLLSGEGVVRESGYKVVWRRGHEGGRQVC